MENEAITPLPEARGHDIEIELIVNQTIPVTKEEMTCLQKRMIKERNRAMLKRILKAMNENPYKRYTFDIKMD